jgi:hypothetical protein
MVTAYLDSEEGEVTGPFQFSLLPNKGDQVTVPCAEDPYGVRIYDVEEITHLAAGVKMNEAVVGPAVYLRVQEIR